MKLYKKLVLAGSALALVLLVVAAIRENYHSEWRLWQRRYHSALAERAKTPADRKELDRFEVKPRQLVVLDLNAVDRCVSCHVGMEDPRLADLGRPLAPHSGDHLKNHPAERFGCTVCHRGQGRAMTFREAKATDVFWDYPLLPAEYTQSSCGVCHDPTTLADKGAPYLARGAELFEASGCRSCHRLNGLGGSLGLALDLEGTYTKHHYVMDAVEGERTTVDWLVQHFNNPQAVIPASTMTTRGLTRDEVRALTTYMLSLKGRQAVASMWTAPDRYTAIAQGFGIRNLDGPTLYARMCRNCHEDGTIGAWNKQFKRFVPAIRSASFVANAGPDFLKNNVLRGRPTTLMAGFEGGLPARDLDTLVTWIVGSTAPAKEAARLPKGDAKAAAPVYAQQCAGCHGVAGEGLVAPQLANPVFQQTANDALVAATIRDGRPKTAMAAFQRAGGHGLSDQELANLVVYVRALGAKGTADGK